MNGLIDFGNISPDIQMFFAGCLGAAAAELMRFYRVQQVVRRPVPGRVILFVSGGQILIAGLYPSFILHLTSTAAAFTVGLTLIYTFAGLMGQAVSTSGGTASSGRGSGPKP